MDGANTQREARATWVSAYPFESANGGLGLRISAGTGTGTSSRTALVGDGNVMILTNVGDVELNVAWGNSAVVATTAYYPLLPGTKEAITIPEDGSVTHVACITPSGSSTLLVHRGYGN